MTQSLRIQPAGKLQGKIAIPGDKSISHRALMISAINPHANSVAVQNWLPSLDCFATLHALLAMGCRIEQTSTSSLVVHSQGLYGLQQAAQPIHVGNSGTTIRLLTGILAAQKFSSVITGDPSICSRPMRRLITPLNLMGAKIQATQDNFAPLMISGGQNLHWIHYQMPMASAQVKSAILLAGLYADRRPVVVSPYICRDHTEIMLDYFATCSGQSCAVLDVPSDISTAAFFIVGACINPGSDIYLENIGINPTRAAVLEILWQMGASIELHKQRVINGEPRADLRVKGGKKLQAVTLTPAQVANAIDEIPILCLAAACAQGTTVVRGANELRYKESDRITAIATGLRALGIAVSDFEDGLAITGGVISGGAVDCYGDHRIAMTFAMAGLVAQQPIIVQDTANIATSFPNFVATAVAAGLDIHEDNYAKYDACTHN